VSYWKAEEIIKLALMAAGRHVGVTLDDVIERFRCSKRTAQRMLRVLETLFPDVVVDRDIDGRKRWRLPSGAIRDLMTLSAEELAALSLAAETMKRLAMDTEAGSLESLREKIMAIVPSSLTARINPDLEALLEAQGLAARPGPRQRIDRGIMSAIFEAIKACRVLEVDYRARDEAAPRPRRLTPYGLLTGLRRYLVARPAKYPDSPVRLYIVENIGAARVGEEAFARDPDFDLQAFADRAFGVFQNEEEFGEVVWRFLPGAAAHAKSFQFHPSQQLEDAPDGSLVVRFSAAGHLEMCWHLYAWGDQVEVLAPDRLRAMVHAWRRSDFLSLP
jgi:predicted DNA-binding transcriptional regulator YafY